MGTTPPALASDRAAGSQSASVLEFGASPSASAARSRSMTFTSSSARRDPGAARRERCRQVHADQDPRQRLLAGHRQHEFRGHDATGALRRLPISFIHQDLGLIDWMTVAENICLTLGYPRRGRLIDWRAARSAAKEP